MKYVDIELLTKEINSLYDKWCGGATGLEVAEEGTSISTAESIFEEVRKIIDHLQQEQPKANGTEKALSLQIQAYLTTASDELYAPGKPLYTEEHHKGIHECMKMWQKLHQYYFSTKQE